MPVRLQTAKPGATSARANPLAAFLGYLQTGNEPYPIEEEVELIAALEAGKRSLTERREVTVAEVTA